MGNTPSQWLTYLVLLLAAYGHRNAWRGITPAWARKLPARRHSYANTIGHGFPYPVVHRALKRHVAQPGRPSWFAVSR